MIKPSMEQNRNHISKQLTLLLSIFLVGFALQPLIHFSQSHYSEALDKQIENAQIQGIIGDEIINHIIEVEHGYLRLVNQVRPSTRDFTLKQVNTHIDEIAELINVLENGGSFQQTLKLNLPGLDSVTNTWHYKPTGTQAFNTLRIDTLPKLTAIVKQFSATNLQMDELHRLTQAKSPLITQQMILIQQDVKRTAPLFIRLQENASQIHYHNQNYLKELQVNVKNQKDRFTLILYSSIATLLLLGLLVFLIISRHIGSMIIDLQHQQDKAQAATESKSLFLANMSHEIRTPLNAITNSIALLKQQEQEPTKFKYFKSIDQSLQSLLDISNDILDFGKIQSNQLKFDFHDFDPHESLSSVADFYKTKCSEKNIQLNVSIDPAMPHSVHSDPLKVKQVLSNLLSNALKFTEAGKSIRLDIEYNSSDKQIIISVTDQGVGISKQQLSHIFEPFSQTESDTTGKLAGTGLGLAISAQLVELLGGDLSVESEPDKGTRFNFKLPIDESQPIKKAANQFTAHKAFSGTILLVEDNATNQILISALLRKMGIHFDLAKDGVEAVAAYQNKRYDLILMDEYMPNMNGSEATQKIRELESEMDNLPQTPIIALTANAKKGDRERFIETGMNDYLSKPLEIEELNRVFDQYLFMKKSETA